MGSGERGGEREGDGERKRDGEMERDGERERDGEGGERCQGRRPVTSFSHVSNAGHRHLHTCSEAIRACWTQPPRTLL